MCRKIIDAIRENYEGADPKAIVRAKRAGVFPLILIALSQYDVLEKIVANLDSIKKQKVEEVSGDE